MPASAAARSRDDAAVFAALKKILEPFEKDHRAVLEKPGYYYIETIEPINKGKPMYLAGVKKGKSYVSYYLMPVYGMPELLAGMSPELRRHMQGKACFNFKAVDEKLFRELEKLTKAGIPNLIRRYSNKES